MKEKKLNLLEWQKHYGTEEACAQALFQQCWPEGFRCPEWGYDHGYAITTRHNWECSRCHKQTSLTAGTLFHSTNLSLVKWFWAIYMLASDKGGISALRLSKRSLYRGLRPVGCCVRFESPWDTGIASIV